MAKAVLVCKVCGKKYEACRTPNPKGIFRWQDVACNPDCGAIYLARVEASRASNKSK